MLWRDNSGTVHKVQTDSGVAQGCALSADIYAISTADTNTTIQQALDTMTANDAKTSATQPRTLTYLDDTFLLIPTIHAPAALEAAQQQLEHSTQAKPNWRQKDHHTPYLHTTKRTTYKSWGSHTHSSRA